MESLMGIQCVLGERMLDMPLVLHVVHIRLELEHKLGQQMEHVQQVGMQIHFVP
jgi:hypothetical protein